jgi:hypothetical protein
MMKWTAALILVLATVLMATPAHAEGSAYMSGSVFTDANANGSAEPGETTVANATVYLRSLADSALVLTTTSNADGNYLFTSVPYGTYETWADDGDANPDPVRIVGFDEVNATVTTDLPIFDNSNDVELLVVRQIFLPAIGR